MLIRTIFFFRKIVTRENLIISEIVLSKNSCVKTFLLWLSKISGRSSVKLSIVTTDHLGTLKKHWYVRAKVFA